MSITTYLGALVAVGVVTGLLMVFVTRHKVEYTVFKTRAGVASLSVARAGRQAADYDAFIRRLVEQIHGCETHSPTSSTAA